MRFLQSYYKTVLPPYFIEDKNKAEKVKHNLFQNSQVT